MSHRRETAAFGATLLLILCALFAPCLFGDGVLSPSDVLLTTASLGGENAQRFEPANRLLTDPALQFEPWLEESRRQIRQGRLPLWNTWIGCGAPHLANGQSAIFDPFHLIAYLGTLPDAHAPMAAARLWVAGLGMFLLGRRWGLKVWGRWFAGLVYPFTGFISLWLLYPAASVAVWIPWLILATDRVLARPGARRTAGLAVVTSLILFGGQVQTAAHALLAAGLYAAWRWTSRRARRAWPAWSAGIALGIGLAAVQIVPLGVYLTRSPILADRRQEWGSPLSLATPRLLDAVCTAIPYAYGSQRRGQPNLARALGVHNINESAGGYAGLATLVCLAPLAWAARRRNPRVRFLVALAAVGALAAFRIPPVDNLLRALPVLGVADNRRLSVWLAFALPLLGGIGLDSLGAHVGMRLLGRLRWMWALIAVGSIMVAVALPRFEPQLRTRAEANYRAAAAEAEGADLTAYLERAGRQVDSTLWFVPRYYGWIAAQGLVLLILIGLMRRGRIGANAGRAGLCGLVAADLLVFVVGLNPSINAVQYRPGGAVVDFLKDLGTGSRVVGIGAEWPPNSLMRYGIADARCYDSIELTAALDWFEPIYEPDPRMRSSRRDVTWRTAYRGLDRLRGAGVMALVGATEPPAGLFGAVERVGQTWIAAVDGMPLATVEPGGTLEIEVDGGRVVCRSRSDRAGRLVVRMIACPGWVVRVDDGPAAEPSSEGPFLAVDVPAGSHRIDLSYEPAEVRMGLLASATSILFISGLVAWGRLNLVLFRRRGHQSPWRARLVGLELDRPTRRQPGPDYHRGTPRQ
ncbi:hypothetical protein EP7_001297 [Isosphaeraceae bacterium EP7]